MSTKKNIQFVRKEYKSGFHKFSTIGPGFSNIPLEELSSSNLLDVFSIRNSNIGIGTMTPIVSLDTNRTDAYKLPSGTTEERPTGSEGYIRYNTTTSQFEGFGAGNSWGSLGGVKSTDQYTYITAELTPGANDSNLRFYTSATQQAIINSQGNLGIGTTSPQYLFHVEGQSYLNGQITTNNNNINAGTATITAQTFSGTATKVSTQIAPGQYILGETYDGQTARTWDIKAASNATPETLVARDASSKIYSAALGIGTTVARTALDTIGTAIINSGNLGIGTASPQYPLHVEGASFLNGQITTNNNNINAGTGTVTAQTFSGTATKVSTQIAPGQYILGETYDGQTARTWDIKAASNATPETLVARDASSKIYSAALGIGTTVARTALDTIGTAIINSGNLGIGTASPQYPLHVEGASFLNGQITTNNNNINAGTGTVTAQTFSGTATQVSSTLTRGNYLTGNNYNGSTGTTWAVDATTDATASKIVARDANAAIYSASLGIGTTATRAALDTIGTAIINSGNLGLGVVTPLERLHVDGNALFSGTITTSNLSVIGTFTTIDTVTSNTEQVVITNLGTGPALKVTQSGNNSVAEFYDYESGIAFYVGNNGYIGIGTSSPNEVLQVIGNINVGTGTVTAQTFSGTATKVSNQITPGQYILGETYDGAASRTWDIKASSNATPETLVARDNSSAIYSSALGIGTTTARTALDTIGTAIINSGNLGIGTASPQYSLHVEGQSYLNGQITTNNNNIDAGTGTVTAQTFFGNFSGGVSGTATNVSNKLTPGQYILGEPFDGSNAYTWDIKAASNASPETLVARDSSSAIYSSALGIGTITARTALDTIGTAIINSGNLGIGTASPQYPLHVEGQSYINGQITTNNNNIDAGTGTVTAQTFLGTATKVSNLITPGQYILGETYDGQTARTWDIKAASNSSPETLVARDSSSTIYSSALGIGTTTARTALDTIGTAIINSGNLGIGTTSPDYPLHVEGASYLNGQITTNNNNIDAGTGTVTAQTFSGTATKVSNLITPGQYILGETYDGQTARTWDIKAASNASPETLVARDSSSAIYSSALGIGTTTARTALDTIGTAIINSGNLGIGTAAPQYPLHVEGASYINGQITTNNNNIDAGTGTVTAQTFLGTATKVSNLITPGQYILGETYDGQTARTWDIKAASNATPETLVSRDINSAIYSSALGIGTITARTALDTIGTAIINSGNLGIGTASPQYPLHVEGASYLNGQITTNNNNIDAGTGTVTAQTFSGTATKVSNLITPGQYILGETYDGQTARTWDIKAASNSTPETLVSRDINSAIYSSALGIGTTTARTALDTIGTAIINSGNLGIGTASPQYPLHVEGASYLNGQITTNNNNIDAGTGTVTAQTFSGTATKVSNLITPGQYILGETYDGQTARTWDIKAASNSSPETLVARDATSTIYSSALGIGTTTARTALDTIGTAIINSGNLGIGVITPLEKLHVDGSALFSGTITTSNLNVIGTFTTIDTVTSNTDQVIITNLGTGPALKVTQSGNNSVAEFYDYESGIAFYVGNNGYIGIGTSSPSEVLQVIGNINVGTGTVTAQTFSGTATKVSTQITPGQYILGETYDGQTARTWDIKAASNSSPETLVARDAAAAIYSSALGIGTTAARTALDTIGTAIINSGNLGIGTASPQYPLHVEGSSYLNGSIITNNNNIDAGTGTITAQTFFGSFSGGVSGTATNVSNKLTAGQYILGESFDGSNAYTWDIKAASNATPETLVARDSSSAIYSSALGIGTTAARTALDTIGTAIINSGNLGIGTATPAYPLHVEGASYLNGSITTNNNNIDAGTATVTAQTFSGTATKVSNLITPGQYILGETYDGQSSRTWDIKAASNATPETLVARDAASAIYSSALGIGTTTARTALDTIGTAIINSGNLGIGTANPQYPLHVEGASYLNGQITTNNNNINAGTGTVTAQTFSGTATKVSNLIVPGQYILGETYDGQTARTWDIKAASNATPETLVSRDINSAIYSSALGIGTTAARTALDTIGTAIINYGNLGIGTATPAYPLHVEGASYLNGSITTNNNNIDAGTGTVTAQTFSGTATKVSNLITPGQYILGETYDGQTARTWDIKAASNATPETLVARDAASSIYSSALGIGTTAARTALDTIGTVIINSGNLGIGTANPQYPLHVEGQSYLNGSITTNNNNINAGTGTVTAQTFSGTATKVSNLITPGQYILGETYDGQTARTWDIKAASNSSPETLVARDAASAIYLSALGIGTTTARTAFDTIGTAIINSGNLGIGTASPQYSLHVEGQSYLNGQITTNNNNINAGTGTVTAQTFSGTATKVSNLITPGQYILGETYDGQTGRTWDIKAASNATPETLVARDSSSAIYSSALGIGTTTARTALDTVGTVIINSGNLGIGVNTPLEKLHVDGNALFSGTITTSNLSVIGTFTTIDTVTSNTEQVVITNLGTGPALKVTQSGNNSVAEFYDYESGIAFYIGNNGYIGIGTSSPSEVLQVIGNINVGTGTVTAQTFSGTATKVSNQITPGQYILGETYDGQTARTWDIKAASNASPETLVARDSSSAIYSSALGIGTTVARTALDTIGTAIINSGNLGIGTAAPAYPLHVEGASYLNGQITTNNNNINVGIGTVTAQTFSGTATQVSSTLTRGTYLTGNDFTGASPTTWAVDATTTATASKVVARDASAYIYSAGVGIGTTVARTAFDTIGTAIINSGNLGIGTTQTLAKVHISDTNALDYIRVTNTTTSTVPFSVKSDNTIEINGVPIRGSTTANDLVVGGTTLKRVKSRLVTYAQANEAINNWGTQATINNQWRAVVWSPQLYLFAAVASSGTGTRVITSSDGIIWTTRVSAVDNSWYSITWAAELGLFVAVSTTGTGNRVMTSPNGINWTTQVSAADNEWRSITWASELGLLVAIALTGAGNRIMTSPDGINWITRLVSNNGWLNIVWSGELGLLVAISYTDTRVATSPDAITWTTRLSAADNSWQSITWSNEAGLFVAVAASGTGNRVATSSDGIIWTTRRSAADNNWRNVTWASELGLFLAIADSGTGTRLMSSIDGINWVTRRSISDQSWYGITWSAELGQFVLVSTSTVILLSEAVYPTLYSNIVPVNNAAYNLGSLSNRYKDVYMSGTIDLNGLTIRGSSLNNDATIGGILLKRMKTRTTTPAQIYDSINIWTTQTIRVGNWWYSVAWSPQLGVYAAVANNGTGNRIATSTDGATWITRSGIPDNNWRSIVWSIELGIFVAVSATGTGNRVITSSDGITWTTQLSPIDNVWYGVTWASELGIFVAIAGSAVTAGTGAMTSPDGINWTTRVLNIVQEWNSITWSAELGLLVVIGRGGTYCVITSPDGITWTTRRPASTVGWLSVVWSADQGLFVAVAYQGTGNRVMTSPDGMVWTTRQSAADNSWRSVTWASELGLFAAVAESGGSGNRLMTSPDGINWTTRRIPDQTWYYITWAGEAGQFVAVGLTALTLINKSTYPSQYNSIVPNVTGIYDIGTNLKRYKDIYSSGILYGSSIDLNGIPIRGSTATNDIIIGGSAIKKARARLTSYSQASDAVNNFTTQVIGPNNVWIRVAWSGKLGLFAAISTNGIGNRVATSSDGVTWITRVVADNSWRVIVWADELSIFAAIAYTGTGNRVMTSSDGITWTTREAADNQWFSLTWSPELNIFVAIAYGPSASGNLVMTSPDGIVWTTKTFNIVAEWYGIVWSPELGIFVAVSRTGQYPVVTSSDGDTWITRTAPGLGWLCITWSNEQGLFVAFPQSATGNSLLITSSDGSSWITRRSAANNSWRSVVWASELGLFVAISDTGSGNRLMTSTNAVTWITRVIPDQTWSSLIWSPELGQFVVVGHTTQVLISKQVYPSLYSGLTPTVTSIYNIGNSGYRYKDVYISGTIDMSGLVIKGNTSANNAMIGGIMFKKIKARLATSAQTINAVTNWTTQVAAANNNWRSIAWAPQLGIFTAVAISGTGNRVMTSSDGIIWTTRLVPDNQWYSVLWAYELSLFIAIASSGTGNRVMTSPDGITWTTQASAADNDWRSITWSPELGLAVALANTPGVGNRIMTSPNGILWTTRLITTLQWQSITWASELGLFIVVGSEGTGTRVATSEDGSTWITRRPAVDLTWTSVTWSPEQGLLVAVAASGTGNRIMTSPDGINWLTRASPADNNWRYVSWSSELGTFVAIADSGTGTRVATSSDGINWVTKRVADQSWYGLVWAAELGQFVAVSNSALTMQSKIVYPTSKTLVAEKAIISGNIGIGTTLTRQALDIVGNVLVTGSIYPSTCNVYDLGSSNLRFKDIYLSGNSINLGDTILSRDNVTRGLKITDATGALLDMNTSNITVPGRIGIGTTVAQVSLQINKTDAILLPAGATSDRPTGVAGYIRYNTTTSSFEGFGPGNTWGSLGSSSGNTTSITSTDGYTSITTDVTTGVSDSNIRFYTGSVQQAIINPQGNVGIGTNTPIVKLHVQGDTLVSGTLTSSNLTVIGDFTTLNTITSNTEQMVITNQGTGPALQVIQTGNNSVAEFYDAESGIALFIGNNGNIGIGTSSPTVALDIQGAINTNNNSINAGTATITALTFSGTATKVSNLITPGQYILGETYDGQTARTWDIKAASNATPETLVARDTSSAIYSAALGIGTTTARTALDTIGTVIINSGNLGIGTTLPVVSLQINKTDAIQLPAGTTGERPSGVAGYIRYNSSLNSFEGFGPGNAWGSLGGGGGNSISSADTYTSVTTELTTGANDSNIRFYTGTVQQMVIDPSGNVGIGTTSPTTKLHVEGSVLVAETLTTSNLYVYNTSFYNNDSPYIRQQLQLTPTRSTFIAPPSGQSNFQVTINGLYKVEQTDVNLYLNGYKLAYMNSTSNDYTISYTNNISDTTLDITTSKLLANGDILNVEAWPSYLSSNVLMQPGYVLQNITYTHWSFNATNSNLHYTSGNVGIGVTNPTNALVVSGLGASDRNDAGMCLRVATNSGTVSTNYADGAMVGVNVLQTASASYRFIQCSSGYGTSNGTMDAEYIVYGDGTVASDGGTAMSTPADYAEMFEWTDGNTEQEDRVGYTVVITSTGTNTIRKADVLDDPALIIGVVSANPAVVADTAWNYWAEKYLKDEFNRYIMEEYPVFRWIAEDGSLVEYVDRIPDGVTPSPYMEIVMQKRKKINPQYNPNVPYIPRQKRPEWDAIGLVGKLRIRKGQPVGLRWLKLRDISNNVEEWLVR